MSIRPTDPKINQRLLTTNQFSAMNYDIMQREVMTERFQDSAFISYFNGYYYFGPSGG
jgi:hypothetical protein